MKVGFFAALKLCIRARLEKVVFNTFLLNVLMLAIKYS